MRDTSREGGRPSAIIKGELRGRETSATARAGPPVTRLPAPLNGIPNKIPAGGGGRIFRYTPRALIGSYKLAGLVGRRAGFNFRFFRRLVLFSARPLDFIPGAECWPPAAPAIYELF